MSFSLHLLITDWRKATLPADVVPFRPWRTYQILYMSRRKLVAAGACEKGSSKGGKFLDQPRD
jgi:hypothetical protein